MHISGQAAPKAVGKPVSYDRQESDVSDTSEDTAEDDGPPRPEEFGGMLRLQATYLTQGAQV